MHGISYPRVRLDDGSPACNIASRDVVRSPRVAADHTAKECLRGYLKLNMEDLSLEEEVVRERMIKQAKATLLLLWKQEPLLGEKAEKRLHVLFKDFMRKQDFALLQGVPGSRVVVGRSYDLIDDINLPREPFLFLGIGVSLGIERIDKPGELV